MQLFDYKLWNNFGFNVYHYLQTPWSSCIKFKRQWFSMTDQCVFFAMTIHWIWHSNGRAQHSRQCCRLETQYTNTCYGTFTNVVFRCVCLIVCVNLEPRAVISRGEQTRYGWQRRTRFTARLIKLYGGLRSLRRLMAAYGGGYGLYLVGLCKCFGPLTTRVCLTSGETEWLVFCWCSHHSSLSRPRWRQTVWVNTT